MKECERESVGVCARESESVRAHHYSVDDAAPAARRYHRTRPVAARTCPGLGSRVGVCITLSLELSDTKVYEP